MVSHSGQLPSPRHSQLILLHMNGHFMCPTEEQTSLEMENSSPAPLMSKRNIDRSDSIATMISLKVFFYLGGCQYIGDAFIFEVYILLG